MKNVKLAFDIDWLKNDSSNYQVWSLQMQLILWNHNLWAIIDGTKPEPAHMDIMAHADWEA